MYPSAPYYCAGLPILAYNGVPVLTNGNPQTRAMEPPVARQEEFPYIAEVTKLCFGYGYPFHDYTPVSVEEKPFYRLRIKLHVSHSFCCYVPADVNKKQLKRLKELAYKHAWEELGEELRKQHSSRKTDDLKRKIVGECYLDWSDKRLQAFYPNIRITYDDVGHFNSILNNKRKVIGFDTEGQPACTLAVASSVGPCHDVAVVSVDLGLEALRSFLRDVSKTVVVCDGLMDLSQFPEVACTVRDVQDLVRLAVDDPISDQYKMGLVDIIDSMWETGALLKPEQLRRGKWTGVLSHTQVFYAACDAFWTLRLFDFPLSCFAKCEVEIEE